VVGQLDFRYSGQSLPIHPHPSRSEPNVWVSRVLLLRTREVSDGAVIRDIRLRRGLNILWAPAEPSPNTTSPASRLTGHSAGKTTFCRLIRYLLGEERFGTSREQEKIRSRLPDGWVVGEIFVQGKPWVVGRPFGRGVHPFAVRDVSVEEALDAGGQYQHFLSALNTAVAAVPVQRVPHTKHPIDWSLVLTWLTRDQEARFARIDGFRDPSSGSESPSPTVGDRHVLLQALLGLMSDADSTLQERVETLGDERKHLDGQEPGLRARAIEDRRRLMELLGTSAAENDNGPLFTAQWLADHRADLERSERAVVEMTAELVPVWQASTLASEEVGARDERHKAALEKLSLARDKVLGIGAAADDAAATDLVAPKSAAPGFCNVRLTVAKEKGCRLATDAPAVLAERRVLYDAHAEATRLREDVVTAEREVAKADLALMGAREAQAVQQRMYELRKTALDAARSKVIRGRAALGEMVRLQKYAAEAERAIQANATRVQVLGEELRRLSDQKVERRREHDQTRVRFEERFRDVVRAFLGDSFDGQVGTPGGQIELHVTDRGERTGAAMSTVSLLAFDLAALTFGVEGHGCFPGFLIHDGPREADMALNIYHQLFRYAVRLENSFLPHVEPPFQYIVTTTASPPEELARAPWLIDLPLDASVKEGRLLKEDL
jgi:hypothetical protein